MSKYNINTWLLMVTDPDSTWRGYEDDRCPFVDSTDGRVYRQVGVQVDEGPTFSAYWNGERWNGWVVALFNIQEAYRAAPYVGARIKIHCDGGYTLVDSDGTEFDLPVVTYVNDVKIYDISSPLGICWNLA